MPLLMKLVGAFFAFLIGVFVLWLMFQILMYFLIFMTGAVGLTGFSEKLKDFQYATLVRIGNVFRKKENKKSTERTDTKVKG